MAASVGQPPCGVNGRCGPVRCRSTVCALTANGAAGRHFEGKVAFITGGGTGIGRSAVLALARAGFDVAINYASSAKAAHAVAEEAQDLGARTLLLQCDVSNDAAVRQMLAKVGEAFGHLDTLINNAGTT
eukprot:gene44420-59274_t